MPSKSEILALGQVIDHLVDAIQDPGASLRRTMILLDIDQHAKTTQNGVGERLQLEKSVVSRNVEWLCERGCVIRNTGKNDARESELQTSPYTHKHLQLAFKSLGNKHEVLQKSLIIFIDLFSEHMPTLREVKALLVVAAKGTASRADIVNNLYDGPATTDLRAIRTLIEEGAFKTDG